MVVSSCLCNIGITTSKAKFICGAKKPVMDSKHNVTLWGIHMGARVGGAPIEEGYVGIGWHELGDLSLISSGRESFKKALTQSIRDVKPGAVPVYAGVLHRYVNEMQAGDYIVYPSKSDRMVNIGRVIGSYVYKPDDPHGYPNHRHVEWLASLPRTEFSQSTLNEIGSFMTFYKVKNSVSELLSKIGGEFQPDVDAESADVADDDEVTKNVSVQAQETAEDFIINRLYKGLDGFEFEHFVAHLLECMGYTARVSAKTGDGGVDVIAHKDELGFEPPILKVQCKRIISQSGEPEVNQLLGTLGEGEFGLFVNLGSYSRAAKLLERNRAKLRLIDGEQIVDLIQEHYEQLSPRYRTLIPLKRIYVPDLG